MGRVVSELLRPDTDDEYFDHSVLLTEMPKDTVFLEKIRNFGIQVDVVSPKLSLVNYAEKYDLVHINWWNSPSLMDFLNSGGVLSIPTIAWAHYSGVKPPLIQVGLLKVVDKLIFSSHGSSVTGETSHRPHEGWTDVIPSSCGSENFYVRRSREEFSSMRKLRFGYIGSCHPSKISRDIGRWALYLRSHIPDFKLHMWGDRNGYDLLLKSLPAGIAESVLIHHGFLDDVGKAYAQIDVMIYLLNSDHYGTGENAIVEAMASGAVVIVMDNPLERNFIDDGINGYVVKSKAELLERVRSLSEDRSILEKLSTQAQKDSLRRFSSLRLKQSFTAVYHQMLREYPRRKDFTNFLGSDPVEWYESFWDLGTRCRETEKFLSGPSSTNIIPSKGSLEHYAGYFGRKRLLDILKSRESKF